MNSGGLRTLEEQVTRGFINAFELNPGIPQQLFHSDSKSWNDRGYYLKHKSVVGLEKRKSKLSYQEWILIL